MGRAEGEAGRRDFLFGRARPSKPCCNIKIDNEWYTHSRHRQMRCGADRGMRSMMQRASRSTFV